MNAGGSGGSGRGRGDGVGCRRNSGNSNRGTKPQWPLVRINEGNTDADYMLNLDEGGIDTTFNARRLNIQVEGDGNLSREGGVCGKSIVVG